MCFQTIKVRQRTIQAIDARYFNAISSSSIKFISCNFTRAFVKVSLKELKQNEAKLLRMCPPTSPLAMITATALLFTSFSGYQLALYIV